MGCRNKSGNDKFGDRGLKLAPMGTSPAMTNWGALRLCQRPWGQVQPGRVNGGHCRGYSSLHPFSLTPGVRGGKMERAAASSVTPTSAERGIVSEFSIGAEWTTNYSAYGRLNLLNALSTLSGICQQSPCRSSVPFLSVALREN